jgi:hypothetical protein
MKILAIEREYEGKTAKDFQPHLEAEARRVWKLYINIFSGRSKKCGINS